MKKLIFCFDIDNILCISPNNNYKKSKPIKKNIRLVNYLINNGHFVKLFTSRYMGRNKDNIKKAKAQGYKKTYLQLKNWGLKFNELRFGKPSYDYFLDDKNIFFKKDWHKHFKKNYF